MNKVICCLLFVLVFFISVSQSYAQAFKQDNQVVQVGIGFGLAGIYGSSSFPPITASYEYAIDKNFSLGGIVGYASSSDTYNNVDYTYSYLIIGARGAYHFPVENVKIDPYVGATLGYNIVSFSSSVNQTGYTASGSYALFGIHGGVRYYFQPNMAVFGEVGYGIGFLDVGISFKL